MWLYNPQTNQSHSLQTSLGKFGRGIAHLATANQQ